MFYCDPPADEGPPPTWLPGDNRAWFRADPPADEDPTPAVDWEPGPYGTEAHHA